MNQQPFRKNVDKLVRILLVFLMSVIVIDVLIQVISRYLFQSPLGFTDELAGYLLIWVGLLGAAYATGEKQHLAIDLISGKFSPNNKKKLDLFITICVCAFAFSVLVVGGIWLVYTSFLFGQISAAMEVPLGIVYLVVPLSGFLIVYYSIDNLLLDFKNTEQTVQ